MFNRLFALMFTICCLLNADYAILRSARNALVVADLGKGAESVPIFELFGTMPASLLMVYLLTRLLSRFSIHKVFLITLQAFSLFCLLFAFVIYPYFIHLAPQLFSLSFFVMAELWKIALLTVLFFGLINQYVPIENAKKIYSPLMLGGSVGTILAGPVITLCCKGSWESSLMLMMLSLSVFSIIIGFCYTALCKELGSGQLTQKEKPQLTIRESIKACLNSRYLLLLGWITIADYIAYAVGETIFLDVLKRQFPNPRDYCDYMGTLSSITGAMTAFCAIFITPYLLRRCHWVVAAIIPALCIFLTEGLFFFAISASMSMQAIVLFGAAFFALSRATKSTLYDTSKEISFLLLPPLEKLQGKLIVDGMCSRLGRGGASVITITFVQLFGGVLASAPFLAPLILLIGVSCVFSTLKLGKLVEQRA